MGRTGKLPLARYDPKDKARNARTIAKYMLARTQAMFTYRGLPDSIPRREYELMLQTGAHGIVTEHEGELYFFQGGLGGEPNAYYFPTIYTVANPYLRLSKQYRIGNDCVLLRNDSMYMGILPILEKYGYLMAENELTMRISDVQCRIISLINAGNDDAYKAAMAYLGKIESGELAAIADNSFTENIKTQPYGSATQTNSLTDLIEYEQYLKASMYNELGLQSNFNMKRESIAAGEAALNEDCLRPLVDDMLACRQECWEEVNKKYGIHVTVELASAWREEAEPDAQPGAPVETEQSV